MLCVLSPAKAMDLSGPPNQGVMTKPKSKDTEELLKVCQKLSAADLKKLMGVSDAIAQKDYERYQQWDKTPAKAAALAMDGPAFRGLDAGAFSEAEKKKAQDKVRILSGLYGVLKPFDAIRPYRLEMGSKLVNGRGKDLYAFWGDKIAKQLKNGTKLVVNAASQEYWKSVDQKALGVPVLTIDFPGPAVYAKKARGLICRFAVTAGCQKAEDLKAFKGTDEDPYVFDASKSSKDKYVFRREAAKAGAGGKKRTASQAAASPKKKAKKS
eukprot:TRINITY_DN8815_c0_g1_i1.p1 TRINITY_DN8815_c0_g1~~TRINITY_DN8815_c0_g1_i1.p1  ORF type:complete len:268 (-),score=102.12 TRINITY_DN8815_c0_g1_i1:393-1196(-)